MKRTCNNCVALEKTDTNRCGLGYKINQNFEMMMGVSISNPKPAEECPKPITIGKYMNCRKTQMKK